MRKSTLLNVLVIIFIVVWIVIMIFQAKHPLAYRGFIGFIGFGVILIFNYIRAKINNEKSPMYDPDKKKHIRNWLVLLLSCALTVIIVSFVYLKFFDS